MTAYYNENDAEKAAWLRELIRQNVVAHGEVDTRSIKEVSPEDLKNFAQCHFFAGIGVWSYALRLAGWPDNLGACWPHDRPVWTGSCPCPSFSAAGKGAGFDDPRHLWPDWARLIRECKPATIFGEQADDAIGYGWLDLVQTDLERENYAVGKAVLGACSVGAPHIRQRLYFVPHSAESRRRRGSDDGAISQRENARTWASEPQRFRSDGGMVNSDSERCGEARIRAWESRSSRAVVSERLADANGRGFAMRGEPSEGQRDGEQRGATSGLEHADQRGSQVGRPENDGAFGSGLFQRRTAADINAATSQPGHVNGFWRDADWILRKRWNRDDWEWCPAQPGAFPLVAGAANRVLKLRGYGDAIVPQVAAAFIEAYLESQR